MPSGNLWRRFNLGANTPGESGLFVSWGNIDGHAEGSGYDFSQEVYDETDGALIESDLSGDNDIARVSLGGPWQMPSAEDFDELVQNCTSVWTVFDGVRGRLFTSNINGKALFFPAAGYYDGAEISAKGTYGSYWANTYLNATSCRNFDFNSTRVTAINSAGRHDGTCVRPVIHSV